MPRARDDGDGPLLEGLAERLEDVAPELRELVQEQDAVVGEAHLAGPRKAPAADQGGVARRMVWAPERPGRDQIFQPDPCGRVDGRGFERLLRESAVGGVRGDGGRAWSFRSPGGPRGAGCGPRRPRSRGLAARGSGRVRRPCPGEGARRVGRAGGEGAPVGATRPPGPRRRGASARDRRGRPHHRGFAGVGRGHESGAEPVASRGHEHHGQDARRRGAGRRPAPARRPGAGPISAHAGTRPSAASRPDRRCEVVGGSHLPQAGRRHAHGDAAVPLEAVAAVAKGGADAALALTDGRVGQAQHGEPGEAAAVSASTRTRWASTPRTAAVRDVASMKLLPPGGRARARRCYPAALPTRVRSVLELVGGVEGQGVSSDDHGSVQTVPRLDVLDRDAVLGCDRAEGVPRRTR